MPIHVAVAYVFASAEKAADMAQKPVYILNHATTRPGFGLRPSLDLAEDATDATARKLYEGSGVNAADLDFENMYDGFATFHNYHLEGLGFAGIKRGEALDFYQGDISIEGPTPISPSGGNVGAGRTRIWMHTDSILQLQGRAGDRQVQLKGGQPRGRRLRRPDAAERRLHDLGDDPRLASEHPSEAPTPALSGAIRRGRVA